MNRKSKTLKLVMNTSDDNIEKSVTMVSYRKHKIKGDFVYFYGKYRHQVICVTKSEMKYFIIEDEDSP